MRRRAWIGYALALVCAGCAPAATQLVVVVDTDITFPTVIDEITVEVTGPSAMRHVERTALVGTSLPLTVGVSPSGAELGPIDVVAIARHEGSEVARRTHRTSLVRGETRMLIMHLSRDCLAAARCGVSQTCSERGCAEIEIEGESLPPWSGSAPRIGVRDGGAPDAGEAGVLDAQVLPDGAGPDASVDAGDGGRDSGFDGGSPCTSGTPTRCGTDCVDSVTDERHCGICGNTCSVEATCWASECGFRELMCGAVDSPPVPPLTWSTELEGAGLRHARDMAMRHMLVFGGSDGSTPESRAAAAGYPAPPAWMRYGIFLMGYTERLPDVVDMLLADAAICQQIMSSEPTHMGAAAEDGSPDGLYWSWYLARP